MIYPVKDNAIYIVIKYLTNINAIMLHLIIRMIMAVNMTCIYDILISTYKILILYRFKRQNILCDCFHKFIFDYGFNDYSGIVKYNF